MKSLKGQLLLAAPQLLDPNFAKSIVLMVQHDDEGALGLILNRATELTVRAAWEQVSDARCAAEGMIFQGGPCRGPLMVVHTLAEASEVEVCEGVHFATDPEKVEWLVARGAEPAKFLVGYAGWGPGQLESEMTTESWLVAPASTGVIFGGGEHLWETLLIIQRWSAVGVRSLRTRFVPTDPTLN